MNGINKGIDRLDAFFYVLIVIEIGALRIFPNERSFFFKIHTFKISSFKTTQIIFFRKENNRFIKKTCKYIFPLLIHKKRRARTEEKFLCQFYIIQRQLPVPSNLL